MSFELPLVVRKPWPLACSVNTALNLVEMIVKSESPPPPARTKFFHLSFLDQNVVRVYTQTLLIFPVSSIPQQQIGNLVDFLDSFRIRMRQKPPFRPLAMASVSL